MMSQRKSLTFRVSPPMVKPLHSHHEDIWLPLVVTNFTFQLTPDCNSHIILGFVNSSLIQTCMEGTRYLLTRFSNSHHPSPKFGDAYGFWEGI